MSVVRARARREATPAVVSSPVPARTVEPPPEPPPAPVHEGASIRSHVASERAIALQRAESDAADRRREIEAAARQAMAEAARVHAADVARARELAAQVEQERERALAAGWHDDAGGLLRAWLAGDDATAAGRLFERWQELARDCETEIGSPAQASVLCIALANVMIERCPAVVACEIDTYGPSSPANAADAATRAGGPIGFTYELQRLAAQLEHAAVRRGLMLEAQGQGVPEAARERFEALLGAVTQRGLCHVREELAARAR